MGPFGESFVVGPFWWVLFGGSILWTCLVGPFGLTFFVGSLLGALVGTFDGWFWWVHLVRP